MQAVAWPLVLSRLWVALFAYVGHAQRPFLAPISGGWEGVANWWLNPWTTYDSSMFLRLAAAGYELRSFDPVKDYLIAQAALDLPTCTPPISAERPL